MARASQIVRPMSNRWIALVGPEIEENLSLRYLASSLRAAGFRSRIVAFNSAEDLPEVLDTLLEAEPPFLIGLSLAFQWRAPDFLGLAVSLREHGFAGHLTAGGHFATFACTELLADFPELDTICRQEAEQTIVALARALQARASLDGLEGISFRNAVGSVQHNPPAALPDLSELPWPDRSGEPANIYGHRIAPIVASRGCYANCTFCCIAAWHQQALPGKRYRLRPVEDVADEMAWLHRERGIEIFVFHDDNFFLPRKADNLVRLGALADALDARGLSRFATVVKARPTDVSPEVFGLLQARLHCLRAYVGIETDSEQGLITLRRGVRPRHNRSAIDTVRDLRLLITFNVLLFDPDTTVASLEHNLSFLESTMDFPFNFARTELYAGTPLLSRMQAEGRTTGDYLQHDYTLASREVERIFDIARVAFAERNFGAEALANTIAGTVFEAEVSRFFHATLHEDDWRLRAADLCRRLGGHSVAVLREIVAHVSADPAGLGDATLTRALTRDVTRVDGELRAAAEELSLRIHVALGQVGTPLTARRDVTATPLQGQRTFAEAP